ncbi:MAG: hypothetical protein QF472_00750 [Candidatus Marinimicrobia bacterium]|jgi:hypothetical protein|nr:hypothetical protein [Candidatus Neomarinimicrobiota bacterium]MDP6852457.1 hypothetical protein [Candidatus Neomarinimicrobiota bacterium]
MNILKTLATAIIGIIVVILLGGLFIDGTYSVQREITINKPVGMVYNYILYLKNQDNFSVWAGMVPEMKKEYKRTDGKAATLMWVKENRKL